MAGGRGLGYHAVFDRYSRNLPMPIKISQLFDSGAIDVVDATDPRQIDLELRRDSAADIHQWFHFRLQGARAQPCTIRFLNAGQATYPKGFEGYQVAASYDTETRSGRLALAKAA